MDLSVASARDLVERLGLDTARNAERPRVLAVMIASADGRAAVAGRTGGLGHPVDRALLRELRAGADALLVGSTTLATERYANLLDDDQRARRVAVGRPEHPLVVTISRRLDLPVTVPLLHEPGRRIVLHTESGAPALDVGSALEVCRHEPGRLDLPAVLADLGRRGMRSVVCEGGPSLLRELVASDGMDDLILTVAPLLIAGHAPTILEGAALPVPMSLRLRELYRAEDHVFLHYDRRPVAS